MARGGGGEDTAVYFNKNAAKAGLEVLLLFTALAGLAVPRGPSE